MTSRGLRVTGGRLGGRRLRTPARGVRPTSDRVREALFARLGDLSGTTVLDLYAGSGVLGVEALSRGAERVVFVERDKRAVQVLRENLSRLGVSERGQVIAGDAPATVRRLARSGERFELVLLDPPYASDEAGRALEALGRCGVLAPGAMVVIEHGRRHPVSAVAGLTTLDERRYGESQITRLSAGAGGGHEDDKEESSGA